MKEKTKMNVNLNKKVLFRPKEVARYLGISSAEAEVYLDKQGVDKLYLDDDHNSWVVFRKDLEKTVIPKT